MTATVGGGDTWRDERSRRWWRSLFVTLVERQWRIRAKRSLIGFIWPVVAPIGLALLYVVVFKRVFAVPIDRYPIYLVCGLLPWVFFTTSLTRSVTSVAGDSDVVRKARFPYELLPLSVVAGQAVILTLNVVAFVVFLAVRGELRLAPLPSLAIPALTLLAVTSALALLASIVDVYTRDLRFVLGNALSVWFFLVPIVYRRRMAPGYLRSFQAVDPMAAVVEGFRSVLYDGRAADDARSVLTLAASVAVLAGALAIFRRRSRQFGSLLS